jgi:hypothetical protein
MLTTQEKQNFDEIPEVVVSFISAKIVLFQELDLCSSNELRAIERQGDVES